MSTARAVARIAIAFLAAALAVSAVFQTAQGAAMPSSALSATGSVDGADRACCDKCSTEHVAQVVCVQGCVGVSAIVSALPLMALSEDANVYPVEPPSFAAFLPSLDPDPPRAMLPG